MDRGTKVLQTVLRRMAKWNFRMGERRRCIRCWEIGEGNLAVDDCCRFYDVVCIRRGPTCYLIRFGSLSPGCYTEIILSESMHFFSYPMLHVLLIGDVNMSRPWFLISFDTQRPND